MFCTQCGTNNPDYSSFCRACGRQIEKENSVPQPSSAYNIVPPASEVFYAPGADSVPTESYSAPPSMPVPDAGLPGGAYVDMPNAPPPPPIPPARPSRFKELAKPLPLWAFIGTIIVVAGLLILLQLTGADWAVGAYHVAIAAGITALLIALAAGIRGFAGMADRNNSKRVVQFVSSGGAILLLLAFCLAGFTQQATLHGLQAHNLEGQQQWQTAINEYQLAGETAPTSDNLARVYNEWGEQLTAQQRYEQAFTKFDVVLNSYSSLKDEVKRAHEGKIKAYLGWAKQAADQRDYATATTRYDQLLQLDYCDVSCQTQANTLDATAYYNLAESQLTTQDYNDAMSTFNVVVTRFPNSAETAKLHGDYAKALFGEGQQQLASSCPGAIPTYQQLSTQFADTPQGQQAAAALKAPQPVKGHFIGIVPQNPSLTDIAVLMKGLYNNFPRDRFFAMLGSAPTATIQRDGSFTFQPVQQGTYDLVWGTNNNADGAQYYIYSFPPNPLVITVGPLCAYDYGDINQNVPAAP